MTAPSNADTDGTAPAWTESKEPGSGPDTGSWPTTWPRSRTWPANRDSNPQNTTGPGARSAPISAPRVFQVEVASHAYRYLIAFALLASGVLLGAGDNQRACCLAPAGAVSRHPPPLTLAMRIRNAGVRHDRASENERHRGMMTGCCDPRLYW